MHKESYFLFHVYYLCLEDGPISNILRFIRAHILKLVAVLNNACPKCSPPKNEAYVSSVKSHKGNTTCHFLVMSMVLHLQNATEDRPICKIGKRYQASITACKYFCEMLPFVCHVSVRILMCVHVFLGPLLFNFAQQIVNKHFGLKNISACVKAQNFGSKENGKMLLLGCISLPFPQCQYPENKQGSSFSIGTKSMNFVVLSFWLVKLCFER